MRMQQRERPGVAAFVPSAVAAVYSRMVEHDREDRPSAAEVARVLSECVGPGVKSAMKR